jgi:hypothetical protein
MFLLTLLIAVAGCLATSCVFSAQVVTFGDRTFLDCNAGADSGCDGRIPYQLFVTPYDEAITQLADGLEGPGDAYRLAVGWVYVTEQTLNGVDEKWLSPNEFLVDTPYYHDNPVPGEIAGDCEEQACALVSLIRAQNVPAEEVRVVLGEAGQADDVKGHAWVELWTGDGWLTLDPSSGPCWDDETESLIDRQGVPFGYYGAHTYPLTRINVYCNDIYYLETAGGSGNAPDWW